MARKLRGIERVKETEAYKWGYEDSVAYAIRLIRDKLGDRMVDGTWQPGSPLEREIIAALEDRRPL